jgi:hypothetical protein
MDDTKAGTLILSWIDPICEKVELFLSLLRLREYPSLSPPETRVSLRVAEVVVALSQALDLGSGSARWHSVRTCILGMRIAAELG